MPSLEVRPFGTVQGQETALYTLSSAGGLRVAITNYGGIIQSLWVPDAFGRPANVVLGFADLQGYLEHRAPYFGALIGRFGNRIGGGAFTLDGTAYTLPVNDGPNSLHGGIDGFDSRVWQAEPLQERGAVGLRLTRISPDGEEGYPGKLSLTVSYMLSDQNALSVRYQAVTDRATVINLTNHSYFNLAGEGSGTIEKQVLWLNAGFYTPTDAHAIPTGEEAAVAGTPFDFTVPAPIGPRLRDNHPQIVRGQGLDHNFVLNRTSAGDRSLIVAAVALDPRSGRTLRVQTTEPGVQLYSANFLTGGFAGTGGRLYRQADAFCLETQHFPDSPNIPSFPSTVLRPGESFDSTTVFSFSA